MIYFFDFKKYIVDGLYRGYFELSMQNYVNIFITIVVFISLFAVVGLICASENNIKLISQRESIGNVKLFSKKTATLLLLFAFLLLAFNDLFTFASYTHEYLMILKYLAFYFLTTFFTLMLSIYFSGRISVTYVLREGTRAISLNFAKVFLTLVCLSLITFLSLSFASKLSGQNIFLLQSFKIVGLIKALMSTLSVCLGVYLFKESDFLNFSVHCM